MAYSSFAYYYDQLTENIEYEKRAGFFVEAINKYSDVKLERILDLACGTGSLSLEFAKKGYKVIATDISQTMLEIASGKLGNFDVEFFLQPMENLSIPEKVDAVVCALDSINHLGNSEQLAKTLNRVSDSLNDSGVFIFDVNTLYKHQNILGDNCFVYETPEVFCCWQNSFNEEDGSVNIGLDFFVEQPDGSYEREYEDFEESFFSHENIINAMKKSGLKLLEVFGEDSFNKPTKQEQRLVYITKKE